MREIASARQALARAEELLLSQQRHAPAPNPSRPPARAFVEFEAQHQAQPQPKIQPYRPPASRKFRKPRKPRRPSLTGEQLVLRGIAVAGVIITIVGVGFAIAVAIQTGLLGAMGRVILTGLLAVALLVGAVLLDRKGTQPVAVAALALTSLLTTFLLVVSLVSILEWWTTEIGAIAFWAIWAFYLGFHRWRDWPVLGVAASILGLGLAVYYPLEMHHMVGMVAIALLPLLPLLATWDDNSRYPRYAAMFALPVASALQWMTSIYQLPASYATAFFLIALTGAVLIVVVSVWATQPQNAAPRAQAVATLLAFLGSLLLAPEAWYMYVVTVAAVGCLVVATRGGESLRPVAQVLSLLIPFSLLLPWIWLFELDKLERFTFGTEMSMFVVLAGVLACLAIGITRGQLRPSEWGAWLFVLAVINMPLLISVLGETPMVLTSATIAVFCLAQIALVAFGMMKFRRLWPLAKGMVWATAIIGLLLSMTSFVGIVVWLAFVAGGTEAMKTGFLIGHATVSIGWMVLAAIVLLELTPLRGNASLWPGAALAAAAVAKLILFDLQTLTGMARALAFLACGLVLLAIVSLRARRRQEADSASAPMPAG